MGISLGKAVTMLAAVTMLTAGTTGCKFFAMSNPFLPTARLIAEPDPTMVKVTYTLKLTDNTITTEAKESDVEIKAYPGDGTPGVFIYSYSAEYFDLAGKNIPSLILKKVNFGVASYVPPSSAAKQSEIKMTLPIYNQQVRLYGETQAFDFQGGASLNANLIHTINCRVTLYGEDDNYNQIEVPLNVPIRFDANITK